MNSVAEQRVSPPRKTRWAWMVATFFGVGFLRPGPGTYGSIAAVLLWMAASRGLHPAPAMLTLGTLLSAVAVTLAGIPAASIVEREAGREDPGFVVIDEVAGQLVALIAVSPDWPHALVSLVLFRAFDIGKPPPIRQLERLPGGTGIMLDDVAAGLFALGAAHLVGLLYP